MFPEYFHDRVVIHVANIAALWPHFTDEARKKQFVDFVKFCRSIAEHTQKHQPKESPAICGLLFKYADALAFDCIQRYGKIPGEGL